MMGTMVLSTHTLLYHQEQTRKKDLLTFKMFILSYVNAMIVI